MVPVLKALRGLFFRMVRRSIPRCSRARGQKSGAPAGPPPSGSVFAAAKRSRASRPPPAGAVPALPGAQRPLADLARFNIARPWGRALVGPGPVYWGGWCRGLLAVSRGRQRDRRKAVGQGRPPGGRWLRRYRLDQVCALVESACLRPRPPGGCPCPGFNAPPAPPEGGETVRCSRHVRGEKYLSGCQCGTSAFTPKLCAQQPAKLFGRKFRRNFRQVS